MTNPAILERQIDHVDHGADAPRRAGLNVLTVNVEDYYQAAVFHRFIQAKNWYRFDSRLQANVEELLQLLESHKTQATFFVLGWIAEMYPELVRRISDLGHEVASRGYLHQRITQLSRRDRLNDLIRSRKILEDTTGRAVNGYRQADGWFRQGDLWVLEDVIDAGYLYDSSLMPRRRDSGGDPDPRTIHLRSAPSGQLFEVPPSTLPFAGSWLPIAGGNYQRQFPHALMQGAVRRWMEAERSPYVMYLQTWEIDSEQPEMSAVGRFGRIRHYRNLGKYRWLLPEYLTQWKFTSIQNHSSNPNSPLAQLEQFGKQRSKPIETPAENRSDICPSSETGQANAVQSVAPDATSRVACTLVIPCYNEESSLPYLSRTLDHLRNDLSSKYDLKILFVDDCSTDTTLELLNTLFGSDPDIRVLHHETNKGVSAAILTGLAASETEIVGSMDCDCSYDPHELQNMLPLLKDDVALVTASPYHRDGGVRNVPAWRLTLSHGLSVLYRLLLRRKLATWTSCFRIYRRSLILDLPLTENGFLGTAEMAAELTLRNRNIVEHPAVLEVRLFGASKMKTLRTICSHLKLLKRVTIRRLLSGSSKDQ
ncbi:MAG: glycosyltransferase [Planctomycetaceae bacterium]